MNENTVYITLDEEPTYHVLKKVLDRAQEVGFVWIDIENHQFLDKKSFSTLFEQAMEYILDQLEEDRRRINDFISLLSMYAQVGDTIVELTLRDNLGGGECNA